MEELADAFPKTIKVNDDYKSFLFQPERVSLNSRQSLANVQPQVGGTDIAQIYPPNDVYSSFFCELKTPLLRVKSLELLRASIPLAVPSIPNNECFFFYYRVDAIPGSPETPNFAQFDYDHIYCVYLFPQGFATPPEWYPDFNDFGWNTVFEDYESLVLALNKACDSNDIRLNEQQTRFIPGDIQFAYDPIQNKIQMIGKNIFDLSGTVQYFYSPVGWQDPNLAVVMQELRENFADETAPDGLGQIPIQLVDSFPLNRRLGFTYAGFGFDPTDSIAVRSLLTRILPSPGASPFDVNDTPTQYTAESYCNLVNTANVFLYADIAGGSTQDTNSEDRLLAVIPTNASSLAVVFGESKIPCELTKTSENVYSITFTMRDDKGELFFLPTNCYVNLELKVTYR